MGLFVLAVVAFAPLAVFVVASRLPRLFASGDGAGKKPAAPHPLD